MWALSSKYKDKLDMSNLIEEELISCSCSYEEREKREEESFQNFYLRSTKFHRLEFVGPRTKVHILDEGYAWVPKRRDFNKDPKEEVLGNQIFQD